MKFLTEKIVLKLLKLEKINRSIVISDPYQKDCPMVFISSEFAKHTGYGVKESLGKNCRFLQGPETDQNDIEHIRIALRSKKKKTIVMAVITRMVGKLLGHHSIISIITITLKNIILTF